MQNKSWSHKLFNLFLAVTFAFSGVMGLVPAKSVAAAGTLTVDVIAGYNLVVDSNVSSPSTYAPRVATVIGKFCNTGTNPLTEVYGHIGDFKGGTGSTPGVYPSRNSLTDTEFQSGQKWNYLYNTGSYFFRHVGATNDASRFIGTIPAGTCRYQYWTIEYPACENVSSSWAEPPCSGDPLWGTSVKPDDDFSLQIDIWGRGLDGAVTRADSKRWTMTMRNQISAMANKIEPNGNPAGRWFNTDEDTVRVGDVITTNGVLYSLGNIRFGFDNDGDYVPDYNAWLQPISQADYDPNCFRLIRTSGVLTVTRGVGNPPLIMPFRDTLYFSNLPPDNTNVRGEVYYTFLALNGPCNVNLSPYQGVASGFDNEKFNGDYGGGIPPIVSLKPEVTIDKTSTPNTIATGATTTYRIPFANTGNAPAGLTLSSGYGINLPLTINDTVPDGMQLVSAATAFLNYSPNSGVTIRYSTDSGATWSTTAPVNQTSVWPNAKIIIQWQLNDPLPKNSTGNYAEFTARVPSGYAGTAFIENTACIGLGDAAPFGCDTVFTLVSGTGSIGDFVWRDENNNGAQTGETANGINGVTVSLYFDRNGDGKLDSGDLLVRTMDTFTFTGGAAGYYQFTQLPAGRFLVAVDTADVQAQHPGYRVNTPAVYAVTLAAGDSNQTADFGFGPSLTINKSLLGDAREGREIVYGISLANKRPGTGQVVGNTCVYELWSSTGSTASAPKNFTDYYKAFGEPDGDYAYGNFAIGANRWIKGTGFDPGRAGGAISKVEALFPLYLSAALSNDSLQTIVYQGATQLGTTGSFSTTYLNSYVGRANAKNVVWDISAGSFAPNGSWGWDDFSLLTLHLQPSKDGGADPSVINLDAIGFRVTVNGACPAIDTNDIMTTVPLTDTFDVTNLQFVSADPPHSAINTTTGLITWNNVGPIYPGETKTVYVRFLGRNIGTSAVTINNSTCSTGTTFADGGSANKACATATGTMNPTGSINGTVFSDPNSTGWNYAPSTDVPIPNVPVTIYGCYSKETGDLITSVHNSGCASTQNNGEWLVRATMLTDATGYYAFNGLLDGFYYVEVTRSVLPGTVTQTAEANDAQAATGTLPNTTVTAGGGNNNSIWGNPTANLGTTNFNPINSAGEIINGVNFGYHINPGVYGSVWEDNNGNGSKNTGEDPIGSVTVWLYNTSDCSGTPVATTTTDPNGRYQFGNLTSGVAYCIAVSTSSLPGGSSAWTQTGESDGSVNNRITFTAVAGVLSGSHDFGFRKTGAYTLGDTLYYDWNGDGTQQPTSEEGIPNVTVQLYEDANGNGIIDPEDAFIASASTNGSGYYQFGSLAAGGYLVIVATDDPDFPASVIQTQDPDESGVCASCNSRGRRAITTAAFDNVDFGYQPRGIGAIGDTVYRDMNGDGVQAGATETGIAGITVWLEVDLNNDGTYVRATTAVTDSNGKYLFSNLPDARYRVVVDATDTDLPKDAYNLPYAPSTATTTSQIIVHNGNTYLDADFGFKPFGAIGDRVWQDNNSNGNQDAGEPGINGVTVGLFTWTDTNNNGIYDTGDTLSATPSATQVTSGDGNYRFTGWPAGNYVVRVISGIPAGFQQSGDPDWLEPCTSTGLCDGASGVSLRTGQIDMSRDFGYKPSGVIGDYIWFDADGDGAQDPGEGGIGFVTVYLCMSASPCDSSNYSARTVTDSDGYYAFGNLNDGTYYVKVDASSLPAGVAITYDLDGGINSPDGITAVTLSGGGSNLTADFGYRYFGTYKISGTTFFDTGNDGGLYHSGTDRPYANITVYLWRDGAIIDTTTANEHGYYEFPELPDGNYAVSVNRNSSQLAGMTQNTPMPTPFHRLVTIAGADRPDQDFGFYAALDYGDLPNSYGTAVANNGAGHIIGALRLGSTVVATADGNPTALADGDADDDGITFANGPWNPGTQVFFTAHVSGVDGYLVSWFDWNNDGQFGDSERIVFDNIVPGNNTFSLNIPSDANTSGGYVYMRFRLYDKTTLVGISSTGLTTNGEVEDYKHQWQPTSVTLVRFEATPQGEAMLITWETATELDNLGFNLHRGESAAGPWARVNAELIPAQNPGAVFGAVYEVLDADVTPGATVYYRLEDVDIHGVSAFHGPISVTPAGASAATVTGFAAQGASGLSLGLLLAVACGLVIKRRH